MLYIGNILYVFISVVKIASRKLKWIFSVCDND